MSWFFDASICLGNGPAQSAWTIGPGILLPLIATILLYAGGFHRLWRRSHRGHAAMAKQAALFAGGWATMFIALVTPLHALSQRLFTAHMIEHELMMAVAAPLIAASAPGAALLWALPKSWRLATARLLHSGPVAWMWRSLSARATATILHGIAIWTWHVPGVFEAVLERGVLHYAQHASFFFTGLLFWWTVLPRGEARENLGSSVMHLFLTSMHTSLLGVLLLFSPRLWYPANTGLSDLWGFSPLEDQQLAGLVMWIPAGLIYGGAALLVAGLWILASSGAREGGTYAVRVS
jgi:putative membrane protein